jgi:Tfp pilus assembly protein PilE
VVIKTLINSTTYTHPGLVNIAKKKRKLKSYQINHFERILAMKSENGRSMVEMLGVLAIIGVLSVGAIAGYSKAMMKYKLNKQAEQFNTIINAVARNVHSFDNISTGYTQVITNYFIKMGEIPLEMIKDGIVYDVFQQRYDITIFKSSPNDKTINLSVNASASLQTKSTESLEICRNMLITAKENADNILYVSSVSKSDPNSDYNATYLWGDKLCNQHNKCLKDFTLDDMYDFCTRYVGKYWNEFKITWS